MVNLLDSMSNLKALPNIGVELEKRLRLADIGTAEEFRQVGTINAFIRIKAIDNDVCVNTLMALEGAIQGVRWHNLS